MQLDTNNLHAFMIPPDFLRFIRGLQRFILLRCQSK
jgi:hypothetical protein